MELRILHKLVQNQNKKDFSDELNGKEGDKIVKNKLDKREI